MIVQGTPVECEGQIMRLLTVRGVRFRVHEHVVSRTVADAVALLPFPADQYLKTVVFRVKGGEWVLVACRGQDRVDYRKLAAACGVRREQIVRAAPEEREATRGSEIGAICAIP